MSIYQKLPPLYDFDNYDHCLAQPSSTYCLVFAEIQSNIDNGIWLNIENLSMDLLHHFRHENLFFGVCIDQCKELLNGMTPLEMESYSANSSLDNEITNYHGRIHKRQEDLQNQLLYQKLLENCLNYRFQQKYNLSLRTNIEYCENSERTNNFDALDITFATILITIIILNIISSLYDYRLKLQHATVIGNNDFYKNKIPEPAINQLLTSFSICRNYFRITAAATPTKPQHSDLNFTYAFRVFALFIVILGHCIMLIMSVQIENPEFIENYYYKAETMLFQNGSAIIQIFFVLAGFLLKLNFDEKRLISKDSSFKMGLFVYIQCFLNRYLRLLPSLLMVILFNATFLIHLEDGPFWRHTSESEYTFCREYWWKNVLMINNHMLEDSCSQHTWFLAADMQLYELFLFTVILTAKFEVLRKPLYILFWILAFLVPGLLTYFYKLDAIHFLKPETFRYLYFKDTDTFYLTYPQFYCNMGGYLVGFMCAEIYLKVLLPQKHKLSKYRGFMKFEIILLFVIFLTGIGLLFSGNLVLQYNFEKPSVWLSLYASLYRNIWSIFGGFILLFMLLKMGWIAYEIACLPIFRILGRISFQSYLWHVTVLRFLGGFYRQPIYLNEFYVVGQIILAFILTNFVAFFVALFVEYPITGIIHYILKMEIPKNQNGEIGNEMKPHLAQIHV
ncbi:nose resistant to fluoxetine protein 6 isoform X2 [Lucilia cuprina]|uniref:nose resistant to fluoxetine protein 6 isoform X2 n=1 Tax=Lucilia cuprina TaxID=7375 RepID=UPI001F065DA2|nr:nose resistant to fluoxetine protein 6 isoform X2 [Lucilia cuprina]